MKKLLKFIFLLLIPISVLAEPPASYRAKYAIDADNIPMGEASRVVETDENMVTIRTSMNTTGLVALFKKVKVEETSKMRWKEGNSVVPLSYHYKNDANGKIKEEKVDFDHKTKQVTYNYRSDVKTYKLQGELDRLSYQINLTEAVKTGKKGAFYKVFDKGEIRDFHFRVNGFSEIEVPAGKFNVVEIERITDNDRITRFWCATELDYLMVKITQNDGDHTLSSELLSYEFE